MVVHLLPKYVEFVTVNGPAVRVDVTVLVNTQLGRRDCPHTGAGKPCPEVRRKTVKVATIAPETVSDKNRRGDVETKCVRSRIMDAKKKRRKRMCAKPPMGSAVAQIMTAVNRTIPTITRRRLLTGAETVNFLSFKPTNQSAN